MDFGDFLISQPRLKTSLPTARFICKHMLEDSGSSPGSLLPFSPRPLYVPDASGATDQAFASVTGTIGQIYAEDTNISAGSFSSGISDTANLFSSSQDGVDTALNANTDKAEVQIDDVEEKLNGQTATLMKKMEGALRGLAAEVDGPTGPRGSGSALESKYSALRIFFRCSRRVCTRRRSIRTSQNPRGNRAMP